MPDLRTLKIGFVSGSANHNIVKKPTSVRWLLVLLWSFAAGLTALTWLHVSQLERDAREREIIAAKRDLSNLSRLMQEHAVRTLHSADQVLRFIQAGYKSVGMRLDLNKQIDLGVIDAGIFNQIGVINAAGIYVIGNQTVTPHIDLSDREHFKVHLKDTGDQIFISKPMLGRASGKWSIQMTRRITGRNGEFLGVAVVSLDPAYFSQFYGELDIGSNGLMALYGLDGLARVRKIGAENNFSSDMSRSPYFNQMVSSMAPGGFTTRSVVDHIERMYFYRRIPDFPIIVLAAIETRMMHMHSDSELTALKTQAWLVTLLIIIVSATLTYYFKSVLRFVGAIQLAQSKIEDQVQQLDTVFQLSPGGFLSFDPEHRVSFANPASSSLLGMPLNALIGIGEDDVERLFGTHSDTGQPIISLATLRSDARQHSGTAFRKIVPPGPLKRALAIQMRLSQSASVSQILHLRDITLETEVESLKSEFLATAAHELRTPMASIYGFSEILLQPDTDDDLRKEAAEIIYRQSGVMVTILNELLDLARIESRGDSDFKYELVTVGGLITDIAHHFKTPANRQGPVISGAGLNATVKGDKSKLRQAFLNVISNAYKYSPGGGPVQVDIQTTSLDGVGKVEVSVRDFGIGMTEDQLGRIFTRFYRADTSGAVPGTGLGLSITKDIIALHKGEIKVQSQAGVGSVVIITLPESS